MCANERIDYKQEILNVLEDNPFGLTITEISDKTSFHRNTVSKYVNILEAESLLNKKKISAARLYFSKKRKKLRKNLVVNFIQALLGAIKEKFPDEKEAIKEIGRKIPLDFDFPIGNLYRDEFKKAKKSKDIVPKLKLFKEFYNAFDFFQDDLEISIIKLNKNKITYRLSGSEFLEQEGKYLYFYFIACGITEATYLNNLNLKIECNVEKFHLTGNPKENFIDITLKTQQ
jgi:DNA-binding MarR family transcriptional regulator